MDKHVFWDIHGHEKQPKRYLNQHSTRKAKWQGSVVDNTRMSSQWKVNDQARSSSLFSVFSPFWSSTGFLFEIFDRSRPFSRSFLITGRSLQSRRWIHDLLDSSSVVQVIGKPWMCEDIGHWQSCSWIKTHHLANEIFRRVGDIGPEFIGKRIVTFDNLIIQRCSAGWFTKRWIAD